jgi:hypothetical protein
MQTIRVGDKYQGLSNKQQSPQQRMPKLILPVVVCCKYTYCAYGATYVLQLRGKNLCQVMNMSFESGNLFDPCISAFSTFLC